MNINKKNIIIALCFILILSFAISSCGGEDGEEKVITLAWTQEPDSLNPFYTNMWYSGVLTEVWACNAWLYDENNEPYPQLLTEMPSISEDGLTITFNLRDDINWSDGEAITSADFVFTYDMIMDDANVFDSKYPYDEFTGVEDPDDQTFVITLGAPLAPWQSLLWGGVLPKHVLQPVFEEDGSF